MQYTSMMAYSLGHAQEWLPLIIALLHVRQVPEPLLANVDTFATCRGQALERNTQEKSRNQWINWINAYSFGNPLKSHRTHGIMESQSFIFLRFFWPSGSRLFSSRHQAKRSPQRLAQLSTSTRRSDCVDVYELVLPITVDLILIGSSFHELKLMFCIVFLVMITSDWR